MSELDDIRAFVRVVEAGTISAAAAQAGVAKSAISRRLADLEKRLGAQLIRRSTRRLDITAAGNDYYERCRQLLADLEAANDAVAARDAELTGRIRIAAPLTFGVEYLGPVLSAFAQAHPQLDIDIDFADRRVDLLREGFDLAVRIGALDDAALAGRRFTHIKHVVCASPAYLETHGTPAAPADLRNHTGLLYSGSATLQWPWRAADGRRGAVTLPGRVQANNGMYLRDATIAGLGICMLPLFILCDAIERGELVPLLTDVEWRPLDGWLVYPRTRHLPARVRHCIDHIVGQFSGTPVWERCLN